MAGFVAQPPMTLWSLPGRESGPSGCDESGCDFRQLVELSLGVGGEQDTAGGAGGRGDDQVVSATRNAMGVHVGKERCVVLGHSWRVVSDRHHRTYRFEERDLTNLNIR